MYRGILVIVLLGVGIAPQAENSASQITINSGQDKPAGSTVSNSGLQTAKPQSGAPATDGPPGAPSELELLHTHVRFENDGTGSREVIARIRILSYARVSQWSELSFDFKPSKERVQIHYVRIVKKDGKVVNVDTDRGPRPRGIFREGGVPGQDFNDNPVTMPPLSPGDTIEYDVETIVYTALTPDQFSEVYSFLPCGAIDEQQLEMDLPADRAVKVKTKPGLDAFVVNENGRRIYRWHPLHQGSECNDKDNGTMHDPQTRVPDVQISSFASWEEVGRWYAEMEKSRRMPSGGIRAKADELTQGLNTDLEKVAALYDFVATKVKYFSMVAFGMGGYEPHTADEVLQRLYGDCKDKDALLAALLEAKGFHSSSVLINPIRELDPDIPSPWPFTHVITLLPLGKDEIWMDTSTGILPFRLLPYALRRKKGLVIAHGGVPHFEETPADAPMLSTWTEEIDGEVDQSGALDATVNLTARGDAEIPLREAFLNAVESARPAMVQRAIVKNFNGQISNVRISNPTATHEPFTMSFQIRQPSTVIEAGTRCTLELPLLNFRMTSADDENGELNRPEAERLRVGPPGRYLLKIKLDLAKGSKPILPPQISLERNYGTYHASSKFEGASLTEERRLIIIKDDVPAALTNEYRSFGQAVIRDYEQRLEFQPGSIAQ